MFKTVDFLYEKDTNRIVAVRKGVKGSNGDTWTFDDTLLLESVPAEKFEDMILHDNDGEWYFKPIAVH